MSEAKEIEKLVEEVKVEATPFDWEGWRDTIDSSSEDGEVVTQGWLLNRLKEMEDGIIARITSSLKEGMGDVKKACRDVRAYRSPRYGEPVDLEVLKRENQARRDRSALMNSEGYLYACRLTSKDAQEYPARNPELEKSPGFKFYMKKLHNYKKQGEMFTSLRANAEKSRL